MFHLRDAAISHCSRSLVAICLGFLVGITSIGSLRAQQPNTPVGGATKDGAPPTGAGGTSAQSANVKDAARPRAKPVADCAGGEVFRSLANTANSPAIIYNGNFVPAGNSVEFGVTSTLDSDAPYFALLLEDDARPADDVRHGARARKAGETDDLVQKRLLAAGNTIVSFDVPANAAGFWGKRNLFIYQCANRRPINVSYLPVYVSPMASSIVITALIGLLGYFCAAKAFTRVTGLSLKGPKAWNPIRITAGSDNTGSLSNFQVFFFTILVFTMLTFVLLRTGVLSDLSTTILELLGISGVGAAAAKGADSSRTTLDPLNEAWLKSKGWYAISSSRAQSEPSFYDLISSDGSFDVYRFQSLLFTAAVGVSLFVGGVFQLASFTVPQNILGILGLSQVVYIAGKLVSSNSVTQLNAVVTDLRSAEAEFREAVFAPSSSGAATTELPAALPNAIERAGRPAYEKYLTKAKAAAVLFTAVTGRPVDSTKLEPSLAFA